MWQGTRVSVILPTYNERGSIGQCVEDFYGLPCVDEVIVVVNNAAEGTREEVERTRARLVVEQKQGYGFAICRGLRECSSDLVVICEPDGTFVAEDLEKLLAYSRDFEVVYGSRTLGWLIWEKANMGWFLRLGNILVAKMIEVLFNCRSLSDVGCTYRLLSGEASAFLQHHCRVGGSHFGPEMMLRSILSGLRVVQIPVNYRRRVGVSSVTGRKWKAFLLGLRMIAMISAFRLGSLLRVPRYSMPRFRRSVSPDASGVVAGR